MLVNGLTSFKVGLQSLTTQSTMIAEFVAAGLTMKETVFFSNIMVELGVWKGFSSVPLYLSNTPTLNVAGKPT